MEDHTAKMDLEEYHLRSGTVNKFYDEARRALREYGKFNSIHEALGVMWEEYMELTEAVHKKTKPAIALEATQLGAMCMVLVDMIEREDL